MLASMKMTEFYTPTPAMPDKRENTHVLRSADASADRCHLFSKKLLPVLGENETLNCRWRFQERQ
jgi:hypothetical protein